MMQQEPASKQLGELMSLVLGPSKHIFLSLLGPNFVNNPPNQMIICPLLLSQFKVIHQELLL